MPGGEHLAREPTGARGERLELGHDRARLVDLLSREVDLEGEPQDLGQLPQAGGGRGRVGALGVEQRESRPVLADRLVHASADQSDVARQGEDG